MTNFDIVLENFISCCDGYMIAEEGFMNDIGKTLLKLLTYIQEKINDLWNKFCIFIGKCRHLMSTSNNTHTSIRTNSYTLVSLVLNNLDGIFKNLEILDEILDYKFKKISHALISSNELRYDSKDVAMKSHDEIIKIIETKYDGMHLKCISHDINEIEFDKCNRGCTAKRAINEIHDRISHINTLMGTLSTNENFNDIYSECNSYMMKLFVPSVQRLKPLKDGLNKTIDVLKRGVPIYYNNRTYSNIIHCIISNASSDWSVLNSLYVKVLNTFKEFNNKQS